MPRTRWHTQIWPTPRVARGKARNDKANREQLALKSGGEEEDRTPDLRIANAALSQLSYFPKISHYFSRICCRLESSPGSTFQSNYESERGWF